MDFGSVGHLDPEMGDDAPKEKTTRKAAACCTMRFLAFVMLGVVDAMQVAVVGAHSCVGRVAIARILAHDWKPVAVTPEKHRDRFDTDMRVFCMDEFCERKLHLDQVIIVPCTLSQSGRNMVEAAYLATTPLQFVTTCEEAMRAVDVAFTKM